MADISGAFDNANEADLIEQSRAADGEDLPPAAPQTPPDQADEADALEQGAVLDDEDDLYPHDS